jgi:hypothetical protein
LIESAIKPPPGQITIPVPLLVPGTGLYAVSVGRVAFVTPITGFEVLTACTSMVLHFRSEPIRTTMEVIMLDRLVEVFCEVDDFCKAFQDASESYRSGNGQGPRGPDPGLADAEISTLLLVLHSSGFKSLKNFYKQPAGRSAAALLSGNALLRALYRLAAAGFSALGGVPGFAAGEENGPLLH